MTFKLNIEAATLNVSVDLNYWYKAKKAEQVFEILRSQKVKGFMEKILYFELSLEKKSEDTENVTWLVQ